ncbi:MAG: hypothetical protein L7S64_03820 [Longimicrobiales bacterium]|nr:hypothetical protein [Longimicrobiales bacterium]
MDRHNNSGHFVSTSFMELVIGLFVVGIIAAIAIRQFPEASLELSPRLNLVLGVVSGTVGVGLLAYTIWTNRDWPCRARDRRRGSHLRIAS